ncbi:epoxide hydrolase [Lasallia pustulata]|uniref:Epoxide hydrolase n=1 Tax=Lasallia pustulata TaxID=136370 RepID=A0A1W5D3C2_9LECA|nr:epoxide hydrolase [Lasallia pustulata]
MTLQPIDPADDSRIQHCKAELNGKTYHYLLGLPHGDFRATIFLIHGWPDLSMTWRNQIPLFLQMGLRVVCPDIMGFGGTDAPPVPPESISYYSFKRAASDIKELARQLGASRIILGGHDWGGAIVYRVALWYPEFVTHLFAVGTPYLAPSKDLEPLEELVKTKLPNFGYQLQLASGDVEKVITSRDELRQFLNALYGGKGPNGEVGFTVQEGLLVQNLPKLGPSPVISEKYLNYYTDQYARNGIHSTLNWYRTREVNFEEELELKKTIIDIPVLFIFATKDAVLPRAMSAGMEQYMPDLTRKEVTASHWALWEKPEEVNGLIQEWLEGVALSGKSTL